jgi:drug/metabolite transporter (DMT)-like permease
VSDSADDNPELMRSVARHLIATFSEGHKVAMTEIGAVGRWLMASLLAINGGAALAVFNADDRLYSAGADSVFFVAGIFAALVSGVLNQKATIQASIAANKGVGHAIVVEHDGQTNEASDTFMREIEPAMEKASRLSPIAGWVSAILFAAGSLITGIDSFTFSRAMKPLCLSLETRMVAGDQAATSNFQALKCHAQPVRYHEDK